MKTQAELKIEIYNALVANTTLPNNIYWVGQKNFSSFPCIVYGMLMVDGDYAFKTPVIEKTAETVIFQIDVYTDSDEQAQMDSYVEAVKTVMETLNYQLIDSGQEFYDTDINKAMRPLRWEKKNV